MIRTMTTVAAFALSACAGPKIDVAIPEEPDLKNTVPVIALHINPIQTTRYRFDIRTMDSKRGLYDSAAGIACTWNLEVSNVDGMQQHTATNQQCVKTTEPIAWKKAERIESHNVSPVQIYVQFNRPHGENETVERSLMLVPDTETGYVQERVWLPKTNEVCLSSFFIPQTLTGEGSQVSKISHGCVTLDPIDFAVRRSIATSPGVSI